MTNLINQVKMDEEDPRYKTLKENFTEEIKKRFYCEDNDAIVK